MKTKPFTILTILLMSSLALVSTAFAQTAVAGVSKGETFDYDYNLLWNSTNPSASPPAFFVNLNETEQIQIKITEISGSRINITVTKHFTNGTQKVEAGYVDIDTGVVEAPYGFLIVSANLSANQQLYPSGGHQTISSTYLKSYSSGQRETNLYISETESDKTEINFDKIKGIAVDYSYQTNETSGGYTTTIKETLTNTNSDVWTAIPTSPPPTATPTATPESVIPEFPAYVIPLILVAAVSLLLVRGKKFSRKPSPI